MITATITNIIKDSFGIRVFVEFKDNNVTFINKSYLFGTDKSSADISADIKTEVDSYTLAASKAEELSSQLVGVTIQ